MSAIAKYILPFMFTETSTNLYQRRVIGWGHRSFCARSNFDKSGIAHAGMMYFKQTSYRPVRREGLSFDGRAGELACCGLAEG
jgi:hypothetical protein